MGFAVKSGPDDLAARTAMVAWLLEQGRDDEARPHIDIAARSTDVKRLTGLVARQRKDYGEAERSFRAMTQESPGNSWIRDQLALVLAEQDDEAKRRRALELAEVSVRQDPNTPEALATLGTVYFHLGRLDEAEQILRAVLGSGKGNSDTVYTLAQVVVRRGRPDDAKPLLRSALDAPGLFISRQDDQQWLDRLTMASK